MLTQQASSGAAAGFVGSGGGDPVLDGQEGAEKQPSKAETKLAAFVEKRLTEYSKGRWAEERDWFESGLFYQQKQWLEATDDKKRKLAPVKVSKDKKYPMPVSDHFKKTIDINAGFLGFALPRMQAMADNYDAKNRRAAEAAENAIDAANEESGMNVLNPVLAVRIQLFGMGITKDTVAFDHSTDEVPEETEHPPTMGPDGQPVPTPPAVTPVNIPSPRLDTTLPPIFNVYLPRDCKDANLADMVIERVTKPRGQWKEIYPDAAFTKDEDAAGQGGKTDGGESLAMYYVRSLRSLSSVSQPQDGDDVTLTEAWFAWTELGDDEQDAIEEEWADQPSTMHTGMTRLQAATQYGLYAICWKDTVVDWGENPWGDDKSGRMDTPYTFFPGGKDPLSVYPRSLATSLKPLQKQLNRYKSYLERGILTNGASRWLWPQTQNGPLPTGDAADVVVYDTLGDGKVKPELIAGNMGDKGIFQMIEMVLADFKDLGYTNEVAEGEMPGAGTAFRALAYLGSKAEESRKPARYLYEQGHEIRARKIVRRCQRIWTTPRKTQTAGFNNQFGAKMLSQADLQGDYQLEVVQDSSRPKTLTEKMEVLQQLVTDGLVDMTDVTTRIYYTSTLGVQEIELTDNLQYDKAERDLELCKQSIAPQANPYTNWAIHFKVFSDYTLTEEYEGQPDQVKQSVLMYAAWLHGMMAPPAMVPGAVPPPPGGLQQQFKPGAGKSRIAAKGGPGGEPASHVLGQVPGAQVSNQMVQHAAETEGNAIIPQEQGAN